MAGDVVISEIMYDLPGADPGREWVEVFNGSNEPVDLSTFKFFEADTNHKLISVVGKEIIPPQSYALIVADPEKFKSDYPDFFGVIFDSTFSLSNTGEVLILKDQNLNVVDQRSYSSVMGGAGDGNSIQLVDSSWVASLPTPGRENKFSARQGLVSGEIKSEKVITQSEIIEVKSLVEQSSLDIATEYVDNSKGSEGSTYFPVIIFVILILFCACFTYFFRRNKKNSSVGDDFEIIEE